MKIGKLEINLNELSEFLVESKRSIYTNFGKKYQKIYSSGPKESTFKKGRFHYTDNHIGYLQFSGTETVEFDANPSESRWVIIWKMNYFGRIDENFIKNNSLIEENYEFLRQALSNVHSGCLFRGPNTFLSSDKNWRYSSFSDTGIRLITAFEGGETIVLKGKGKIYSGNYHGGIIIPE